MANLSVENLSKIVQTGDTEKLFGQNTPITKQSDSGNGKNFSDILKDSMEKVNLYQAEADHAINELIAGRSKNIHETMLTIERADTSLKLMMQVRNKIIDAYKEVMRMQV